MSRRALGASLALHFFILGFCWVTGRHLLGESPANKIGFDVKKTLKVRNVSEKELNAEMQALEKLQHKDQVVQMDDTLKSEVAPTTKTEEVYLSKFDQRVDRNTRARQVGAFKNALEEGLLDGDSSVKAEARAATAPPPSKKGMKSVSADPSKLFALASPYNSTPEYEAGEAQKLSDVGRDPSSVLSNGNEAQVPKKGKGISATDDYVEGVAIGPNTLLNTQEFKYFSFYERIRQQLVERWRNRIRREIEFARGLASADGGLHLGSKITSLSVKLDETGDLKEIEKVAISGNERFDQAAIAAFGEAAPFPHPPKEMLKDGVLTIRWDFVVVVEQASLVEYKVMKAF